MSEEGEKKNTLNLLNSTIQRRRLFLLHYAPLRHNSNFVNLLYVSLRCFVSLHMEASVQGRRASEGASEREPLLKESRA